ncbi:MAG TPA: CARDB domain-containing protein [Thermoplasmata archaeon]|nr:CARDB domain-containing protein [Thermoplasmata archaeon]
MTEPSKPSSWNRRLLAASLALLLAGAALFVVNQLLRSGVTSSGGPGPRGNETLADLSITSSGIRSSDGTPLEGEVVTISADVHNIGGTVASNVTVEIWHDDIDWSYLIGTDVIPIVPPGGTETVSVEWDTTGQPGGNTIEVVVDPDNAIPESDEGNNAASRDIFVGEPPPPSLFVQAWTFDNDHDQRYDDVVILVHDSAGRAVDGASVYVDGVFYGLTPDTGLLVAYNFRAGTHTVLAVLGSQAAQTTFVSEG